MQKSKRWDTRGRLVACSGFLVCFHFSGIRLLLFPPSAFSSKHCYKSSLFFPQVTTLSFLWLIYTEMTKSFSPLLH